VVEEDDDGYDGVDVDDVAIEMVGEDVNEDVHVVGVKRSGKLIVFGRGREPAV